MSENLWAYEDVESKKYEDKSVRAIICPDYYDEAEFIAADILKTIVEPGLHELGILAGVVLLRTILSFFLNKEIIEIDRERHEHPDVFNP